MSAKSRCASSKKKTSFGFSGSPISGSRSNKLREQPEQKSRVNLRRLLHQLFRREDVDDAAARSESGSDHRDRAPVRRKICRRPAFRARADCAGSRPTLAAETLPYCVLNWSALSATYCNIERRSFRSSSSRPLSSAILKTMLRTPSWVSFKLEQAARAAAAPFRKPSRALDARFHRTHPRKRPDRLRL